MDILKELLPGCFLLQPKRFEDQRGYFVKTYNEELYKNFGIDMSIREEFYSVSRKNVLRGMHFQIPPYEHEKHVYCTHGMVMDVLLDLRDGPSYGKVVSAELSSGNGRIVFIPRGIAHGFLALTDEALMVYKTSTVHAPQADYGIQWDSFGFDWGRDDPIVSTRDQQHISFADFKSPF